MSLFKIVFINRLTMEHVCNENHCAIEFQAFRGNSNEFIVKELVVLDLNTNVPHYFLFKPPYPFHNCNKKNGSCNKWLEKHHHCIRWSEGYVEYEELGKIMHKFCSQFGTIFTSGLEKANFISQYTLNRVINVDLLSEIKSINVIPLCLSVENEKHKYEHCALARAYKLSLQLQSIIQV